MLLEALAETPLPLPFNDLYPLSLKLLLACKRVIVPSDTTLLGMYLTERNPPSQNYPALQIQD